MILLDTSGILAALFEDQKHHEECAEVLRRAERPLILSPFVLAQTCAVIRRAPGAEQLFLEEVERGAYQLAAFTQEDVATARRIMARQNVDITTASLVVLSDKYSCRQVLSLRRDALPPRFHTLPA